MRSKKALKNIITSLLQQIVTIVCGFIAPKLIIGTFGSDVNGLVSSVTQFLAYITLLESGMGPVVKAALYKPLAKKDNKGIANVLKASEKFFKAISYIFIVYIIVLCIVYPIIVNNQFGVIFTVSLVIIISISTFAEYYFGMTYKLFLQADQKTYVVSFIQIISTILNTILIVVLIRVGASIQIVKLASAIVFVLRPIMQNQYVKRKYKINLKDFDKDFKLEQKWDGLAQHIAAVVHSNTDVTILTFLSTLKEVSVYSVYMLVVNGVRNIVNALSSGIDATFGDMIAKNEKDILNKSFKSYELLYYTLITIVYICTAILITPFVEVYTKGITDVNYSRPLFGFLIVMAQFLHSIRMPYSGITLAAGHFKETRKGAWVEAISNIVISIILVFKLGLIGVAIGTIFAMFIRTIEFMYHTSKYILERSLFYTFKRLFIVTFEVGISMLIYSFIPKIQISNYLNWIMEAIIVFVLASIVTVLINIIVYHKDVKDVLNIIKRIFNKNKKKEKIDEKI